MATLPPLPENNTDRAWLKYTSAGVEHELCFRLPNATPQADFVTTATAIANGLKSLIATTDSFTGLRHSDNQSNLSFPLAFTPVQGTGGPIQEGQDKSKFMSLVGRSINGYRCRVTFFTFALGDNLNYRVNVGADAGTNALYNTITGLSIPLVAVDGAAVIWNAYINIGYNSYWQRELRG